MLKALCLAALMIAGTAKAAESERELVIDGRVALATLRAPDGVARPPLAIVTHGTLAHKDMETVVTLSKALAEKGVATLAHNLTLGQDRRRGMYDCATPHDHRPDDAIVEIGAWIAEARKLGYDRIWLVGHSRGANQVARTLAARGGEGVAGAALIAPSTGPGETRTLAAYGQTYGADLAALTARARDMVANGRGGETLAAPGFLYCRDARATARAFLAAYGPDQGRDTAALTTRLNLPLLVLAAAQDAVVADVREAFAPIAAQKRNLRVETIAGADHFFLDLAGEDAADRIADFIAGR